MRTGRIVRLLTDVDRKETLGSVDEERKVIISVFYPVDSSWKTDRQALYSDLFIPSQERFIKQWVDNGADEDYLKNLRTNVYIDAPIRSADKRYPVILFSPGCTCDRDSAVFAIERLVNKGYIVITIGALYETELTFLPDGEVIYMAEQLDKADYSYEEWHKLRDIRKRDIIFILNQLDNLNNMDEVITGKLDLTKVGVMGFSLGAVACFEAAAEDKRIKTVVMLDGGMFFSSVGCRLKRGERLSTPLLLLKRHDASYIEMVEKTKGWYEDLECDEFKEDLNLIQEISKTQEQLYEYLEGFKSFAKIDFSDHISFSDHYILKNRKHFGYCGGENNVEKVHEIASSAAEKFFNEFLCDNANEFQDFINKEKIFTELKSINGIGEIV